MFLGHDCFFQQVFGGEKMCAVVTGSPAFGLIVMIGLCTSLSPLARVHLISHANNAACSGLRFDPASPPVLKIKSGETVEVQTLLAGASAINQGGPFYRVIVEPDSRSVKIDGEDRPLPASMQVQAFVLLDQRPLYQWILQPVYDLARAAHGT